MTKIDILNPKLIIPDNYQQCWEHFELMTKGYCRNTFFISLFFVT